MSSYVPPPEKKHIIVNSLVGSVHFKYNIWAPTRKLLLKQISKSIQKKLYYSQLLKLFFKISSFFSNLRFEAVHT